MDAQNYTLFKRVEHTPLFRVAPKPIPHAWTCLHCGGQFVGRKKGFCSTACQRAAGNTPKTKPAIAAIKGGWLFKCDHCETEFTGRARKYCSDECAKESRYKKDTERKLKIVNRSRIKSYRPRAIPTPVIDGLKACIDCGEVHPVSEFPKHKDSKVKGGYATLSRCKTCNRIYNRIRSRINKSIRGYDVSKIARSAMKRNGASPRIEELLGYSVAELKIYLEMQFTKGMNWDRFFKGEIHIDHIVPVSYFDLSIEEQFKQCWNIYNLRPMWAKDNMKKGAKVQHLLLLRP
jgi:hypothetical protein